MIKILNGWHWLEEELGDDTKEIKECLEKELIKRVRDDTAYFLVLENNLELVKEILKDDYNKLKEQSFIDWLRDEINDCDRDLEIYNAFNDKIVINSHEIFQMIKENEISITEQEKTDIYNSGSPVKELWNIITKIGKEQLKIRIKDLLDSLDNCYNEFE